MVFFAAPGSPDSHDLAVYRVGADAAPQGREEDPDGHTVELTYEVPRAEWRHLANPFAGRDPLPFDAAAKAAR